jgi:hypothetical protein
MTALPASRSCDWHAHEFYEPLIRARRLSPASHRGLR